MIKTSAKQLLCASLTNFLRKKSEIWKTIQFIIALNNLGINLRIEKTLQ
jgi:hypothetical protein